MPLISFSSHSKNSFRDSFFDFWDEKKNRGKVFFAHISILAITAACHSYEAPFNEISSLRNWLASLAIIQNSERVAFPLHRNIQINKYSYIPIYIIMYEQIDIFLRIDVAAAMPTCQKFHENHYYNSRHCTHHNNDIQLYSRIYSYSHPPCKWKI